MFCVHVLRRTRLPACRSADFQVTALRHAARALTTACGLRGACGTQLPLRAVRRSSPAVTKVQSHILPARCLSSAAPSEDGTLIYSGSFGTAVRGVKMFSYSTSGASLFLMPQILLKTGLGVQGWALQAAFCGIVGFFTFLTPVLLHLLTKGYVVRLYHRPDTDTYTAVTYSVFLTEKRTVFHQSQVRIPAVSKMFTSFYGNNTGLLVNPDLFPVPHDYNHLMGYDKPFSFSADDMDQPERS